MTRAQLNRLMPEFKNSAGDCPICNVQHTYDRKFPFGSAKFPANRLLNCPKWTALSTKDKAEKVQAVGGCKACKSWVHNFTNCRQSAQFKCKVKVSGNDCGGPHNTLLHGTGVAYCNNIRARVASLLNNREQPGLERNVLLEIQQVEVNGKPATVLFDNGSSATLVTHNFAQGLVILGGQFWCQAQCPCSWHTHYK